MAARAQAAGGPRRGRDQQGEHEPREAPRRHLEAPRHQPVPRDGDVDAHEPGHHEWRDRVRGRHLHPVEDPGHRTAACPVRHGAASLVQDRDREERAQHHREPDARREAGFAAHPHPFDRGHASRDGRVVEPPEVEPAQLGGRPGRLAGRPGEVHGERHRLPEGGHHHEGQPTPGQPGAPPPGEDGDPRRPPRRPGGDLGSEGRLGRDGRLRSRTGVCGGVSFTTGLSPPSRPSRSASGRPSSSRSSSLDLGPGLSAGPGDDGACVALTMASSPPTPPPSETRPRRMRDSPSG